MELKRFDSDTGIGVYSDGKQMYILEDGGKTFIDIHAKVFPDCGDFEFGLRCGGISRKRRVRNYLTQ